MYQIVYIHGFASDPQSIKARYFAERFGELGVPFSAPDANLPNFETLTLTRMVDTAERACLPSPASVVAIGSSLGGYAAALWAAERQRQGRPLRALVMFAPAFGLSQTWRQRLGERWLQQWRETGHFTLPPLGPDGYTYPAQYRIVGFDLYADAERHDAQPLLLSTPTLIFHGAKDRSVPLQASQVFAQANPNVRLRVFPEAGHGMIDDLPVIWQQTQAFLKELPRV